MHPLCGKNMKLERIVRGIFVSRPNRFLAHVIIEDREEVVHVKNTGRLRELLVPGAEVLLQRAEGTVRKTQYDLVAVYKGERLISIDSQAPNHLAAECIPVLFPEAVQVRRERTWGNSRFDFYIETPERRIFMEVKGVTLEKEGVASFPDAPTERGVKHLRELIACQKEGYEAYMLFILQMKGMRYFCPNDDTHPAFGQALREAASAGVRLMAIECEVSESEVCPLGPVDIRL